MERHSIHQLSAVIPGEGACERNRQPRLEEARWARSSDKTVIDSPNSKADDDAIAILLEQTRRQQRTIR
jgi:hypothetical protein